MIGFKIRTPTWRWPESRRIHTMKDRRKMLPTIFFYRKPKNTAYSLWLQFYFTQTKKCKLKNKTKKHSPLKKLRKKKTKPRWMETRTMEDETDQTITGLWWIFGLTRIVNKWRYVCGFCFNEDHLFKKGRFNLEKKLTISIIERQDLKLLERYGGVCK